LSRQWGELVQENHLVSVGKSAAMIRKFKRKKFPFLVLLQENCDPVVVLVKNPQAAVHKHLGHVKPPT
jgi:hypothetical protein